jgi:hypothetical protein
MQEEMMQPSTLPRKRLPAARAVLAVALALVFVLVSAVGLITWNSYDEALERSRARVDSAAQVVATHVEWLTAASLLLMDETNHVIGEDVTTLLGGARAELALHLKHMPPGVSFSIVDTGGHVIFSEGGPGTALDEKAGLTMAHLSGARSWYVSAMMQEAGSGEQAFLIA